MDWEAFYAEHPNTVDRRDHLSQVGHTYRGQPIPEEQFEWIVERITELLSLKPTDVVLDLCCGNGLISRQLANRVDRVVGIDFSEPLIRIANEDHRGDGIEYHHADVLDVDDALFSEGPFDKVLMYGALQHFRKDQLGAILDLALRATTGDFALLLGFVPRASARWDLYDTPRRKVAHLWRRASGRERMGTFWDEDTISGACSARGLRSEFHAIDPLLDASRYRFDILIAPLEA